MTEKTDEEIINECSIGIDNTFHPGQTKSIIYILRKAMDLARQSERKKVAKEIFYELEKPLFGRKMRENSILDFACIYPEEMINGKLCDCPYCNAYRKLRKKYLKNEG